MGESASVLRIDANWITAVLAALVLLFTVLSLFGALVVAPMSGAAAVTGPFALFSLDAENNLPTLFASALLAASALLCLVTFFLTAVARWSRGWLVLAASFLFLAVDEILQFHEKITGPVRSALGPEVSPFLFFAWVIPALLGALVFAAVMFRFWRGLPGTTRWGVAGAALVYLGGGVGMEMVGGQIVVAAGMQSLSYTLASTLEEVLEFAGVILFVRVFLHNAALLGPISLVITGTRQSARGALLVDAAAGTSPGASGLSAQTVLAPVVADAALRRDEGRALPQGGGLQRSAR